MDISLPSIANARLPQTYEAAKTALAQCERIDECQEWANKAEALAAYARMSDDDTLRKLADRIQARAVRRAGELLKTYDGRPDNAKKQNGGDHTLISRADAAREAGMSPHQQTTAVRVANVPEDQFTEAVESDEPPTVTALADMGTKHRLPEPPDGFRQATHLIGTVKRFAEFCGQNEPELVANGVMPFEVGEIRELVAKIDVWLDRFVVNLRNDQ